MSEREFNKNNNRRVINTRLLFHVRILKIIFNFPYKQHEMQTKKLVRKYENL